MKTFLKGLIAIAVVFGGISLYQYYQPKEVYSPTYTAFLKQLQNNEIKRVTLLPINSATNQILVEEKSSENYSILAPSSDSILLNDLINHKVEIRVIQPPKNVLLDIFLNLLPAFIIVGAMVYMYSNQSKMKFGKPAAKLLEKDNDNSTTFDDVAGCENEKQELQEVVDFIKNPEKYSKLGGKIPRGVILSGPSGVGKTELARATANESGVPFYYCSGSSFVEIYVGQGAAKVRDMFQELRKHEKCVLFIDEVDSISKQRSSGLSSNDERDNTLNALLSEMDGIDPRTGLIIIAATNRIDLIDKAFLRPGRFDRQIGVGFPDVKGRHKILEIHTKHIPLNNVDLLELAKRTTGFSGAELKNLANEAAIFAARISADSVSMEHFDQALDKILMGTEKSSSLMSNEEKLQTAYHEVGHFLVAQLSDAHDKAYKMSIRPRANSLGVTIFVPEKDAVSASKKKLESQIATLLAGRIAEELYAGKEFVTTGCSQDYKRATDIATKMVCEWGMSDLAPMVYQKQDAFGNIQNKLEPKVQLEIEELMKKNYNRARSILKRNWKHVEEISSILYDKEDLDVKEIEHIIKLCK